MWVLAEVGLVSPDLWQAYVWPYGALAGCGRRRCHCTGDRGSSHRFSHVGTWCAPSERSAACSPGHSRGRSTVGQRHLASSVPDLGKIERSKQSEGGGLKKKKSAYVGQTVAIWGHGRTIGKALHSEIWNSQELLHLFVYFLFTCFFTFNIWQIYI